MHGTILYNIPLREKEQQLLFYVMEKLFKSKREIEMMFLVYATL